MPKTTLPSIDDFKEQAKQLRKENPEIKTHSHALIELSKRYGYKDYNHLKPDFLANPIGNPTLKNDEGINYQAVDEKGEFLWWRKLMKVTMQLANVEMTLKAMYLYPEAEKDNPDYTPVVQVQISGIAITDRDGSVANGDFFVFGGDLFYMEELLASEMLKYIYFSDALEMDYGHRLDINYKNGSNSELENLVKNRAGNYLELIRAKKEASGSKH